MSHSDLETNEDQSREVSHDGHERHLGRLRRFKQKAEEEVASRLAEEMDEDGDHLSNEILSPLNERAKKQMLRLRPYGLPVFLGMPLVAFLSRDGKTREGIQDLNNQLVQDSAVVLFNHESYFDSFMVGFSLMQALSNVADATVPAAGYLYENPKLKRSIFEPLNQVDGVHIKPVSRKKERDKGIALKRSANLEYFQQAYRSLALPGGLIFVAPSAGRSAKNQPVPLDENVAALMYTAEKPIYLTAAFRARVGDLLRQYAWALPRLKIGPVPGLAYAVKMAERPIDFGYALGDPQEMERVLNDELNKLRFND